MHGALKFPLPWAKDQPGTQTHRRSGWNEDQNLGSRWVKRRLFMMIIIEHDQMILSENDHVSGPIVPEIFYFLGIFKMNWN